jgi:hypothetical protein
MAVPSARQMIWPNEMPFDINALAVPGAVAAADACKSAVIWRASISMNPEPNVPMVLRELPII